MATLLPQTEATGDFVRDRDLCRADMAAELAAQLRDAALEAETIDEVIEQLVWLTPNQKARANELLARHDYRALGKMLCDTHEQLVAARLYDTAPKHVVIWDEGH